METVFFKKIIEEGFINTDHLETLVTPKWNPLGPDVIAQINTCVVLEIGTASLPVPLPTGYLRFSHM